MKIFDGLLLKFFLFLYIFISNFFIKSCIMNVFNIFKDSIKNTFWICLFKVNNVYKFCGGF